MTEKISICIDKCQSLKHSTFWPSVDIKFEDIIWKVDSKSKYSEIQSKEWPLFLTNCRKLPKVIRNSDFLA